MRGTKASGSTYRNVVRGEDAGAGGNVLEAFEVNADAGDAQADSHGFHRRPVHQVLRAGEEAPENQPGEKKNDGDGPPEQNDQGSNHARDETLTFGAAERQPSRKDRMTLTTSCSFSGARRLTDRAHWPVVPRSRPSRMRRCWSDACGISATEYWRSSREPTKNEISDS